MTAFSHAVIISSPDANEAIKKARELALSIMCPQLNSPCKQCRDCKAVLRGEHPDLIVIKRLKDDKGKQKKEIQVSQIRDMQVEAWVRPQFSDKKVFIIEDAETMNTASQNAALKLLEEPSPYAHFILCSKSADALLETVRSRCVLISLKTDSPTPSSPEAEELMSLLKSGVATKIAMFFAKCEAMDTEALFAFLSAFHQGLAKALLSGTGASYLSRSDLYSLIRQIDSLKKYSKMNVGVKHICGMLCAVCTGLTPHKGV